MEDFQTPTIRSYRSYEGNRNLQLVDPADLNQVRGIYVVRESKRTRSSITPNKASHKDLPARPRKASSRALVKGWWSNPEMKRKRRVAKYKIYSAEGKMRSSLKKSYKWFKVQCSKMIHGY